MNNGEFGYNDKIDVLFLEKGVALTSFNGWW